MRQPAPTTTGEEAKAALQEPAVRFLDVVLVGLAFQLDVQHPTPGVCANVPCLLVCLATVKSNIEDACGSEINSFHYMPVWSLIFSHYVTFGIVPWL